MPDIELTTAERIILANQFQLLAHLDRGNAQHHYQSADILRSGYAGLYGHVFADISDEEDESVTKEIHHILSMFRWIKNNVSALTDEQRAQLDLGSLNFSGFDGNHDPHFHQARFMVERLGLYQEQNAHDMNSHSQTSLPRYRRMLAVYNDFVDQDDAFKLENFVRLQEA